MPQTLRSHIRFLEKKAKTLRSALDLTAPKSLERDMILKQLEWVALALDCYGRAYDFEQKLED